MDNPFTPSVGNFQPTRGNLGARWLRLAISAILRAAIALAAMRVWLHELLPRETGMFELPAGYWNVTAVVLTIYVIPTAQRQAPFRASMIQYAACMLCGIHVGMWLVTDWQMIFKDAAKRGFDLIMLLALSVLAVEGALSYLETIAVGQESDVAPKAE